MANYVVPLNELNGEVCNTSHDEGHSYGVGLAKCSYLPRDCLHLEGKADSFI